MSKQTENMLVRGDDLDQLLMLAGEVIIASSNQGLISKDLQDLHSSGNPINQSTLSAAKDLDSLTSSLSADLHHLVQSIRTVELQDLSFRMRRLVRDITRKTGKHISFTMEGEDTTIDKSIIEKLYDPIAHQLRNAIDHGIEDIATRKTKQKNEEAKLVLRAYNTESETVFEIEDDGAGIDLDAIKQKGVALGVVGETDTLTEEQALEIMCSPGVTTAKSLSEISGRGVGMDVVKTSIEDVGGTISFTSEIGTGTTFSFKIPLISAVNIIDALVVRAKDSCYAFPISKVISSLSIPASEVTTPLDKALMIQYLGDLLPLYSLHNILDQTDTSWLDEAGELLSILIVGHKNNAIAFAVDEFLAPQKLVIIPFDSSLDVEGLIGSTILAGNRLGFIIDTPSLLKLATQKATGKKTTGKKTSAKTKQKESIINEADGSQPSDVAKITDTGATGATGAKTDNYESQDQDNGIFRQEYVSELKKILTELNQNVFSLESSPDDDDIINAVFRLFHTIKGNLIMMGLPKSGETVHSVESVLDQARSSNQAKGSSLAITPEVMDIIMDGVSYVEDVATNATNDIWEDEVRNDLVARSESLVPKPDFESETITDIASAELKLTHESVYRSNILRRKNYNFYNIYIEFNPGSQPSFLVACLIYKRLCETGDILGSVPPLVDIENGMMNDKIKILAASEIPHEKYSKMLETFFTDHYGASTVNVTLIRY